MTELVKQPPKLKKRLLTNKQKSKNNFSLGAEGEQRAVLFLKNKGIQIWGTNLQFGPNEVDLIGFDPRYQELIFFEVKTRSTHLFGDPSQAVNKRKIKSIERVAQFYCKIKKLKYDYRFDILAVTPDQIRHYENVTL